MTVFARLNLHSVFGEIKTGDFHASSELSMGNIPLISCKTEKTGEHGVEGYFDIPPEKTYENCMTITCDGIYSSTAFFHPYRFAAKDNVLVCVPKKDIRLTTILYIIASLKRERWRFSYGRKCYSNKIDKLTVLFPVENEKIDQKAIEEMLLSKNMNPFVRNAIATLSKTYAKSPHSLGLSRGEMLTQKAA